MVTAAILLPTSKQLEPMREIAPRLAIAPRPRLFHAGKLDESIPT